MDFYPPSDSRLLRATIPPHRVPSSIFDPGSFFEPPLHFHPQQVEIFTVIEGTMRVRQGSSWQEVHSDNTVAIPAGEFHRFENGSERHALVVDVRMEPPLPSDELFFRNFYSYVEDCNRAAGQTELRKQVLPNPFQAALFLYEGGTVPGIPGLPRWIADPIAYGLSWTAGVFIGKWMLGFKGSYDEYYSSKQK